MGVKYIICHNCIKAFSLSYWRIDIRLNCHIYPKGSKSTNKYGIKITGKKYNL